MDKFTLGLAGETHIVALLTKQLEGVAGGSNLELSTVVSCTQLMKVQMFGGQVMRLRPPVLDEASVFDCCKDARGSGRMLSPNSQMIIPEAMPDQEDFEKGLGKVAMKMLEHISEHTSLKPIYFLH